MNKSPKGLIVEDYRLTAKNGRHIRMATQVRFQSGRVIKFLDKLTHRDAIVQAGRFLDKEQEDITRGLSSQMWKW